MRCLGEVAVPRDPPHFGRIRRAVRRFLAAHPVTRCVVGLSGGADSLALAAGLRIEGVEARAVIVDHGLQPGSAAVAREARVTARRLGMRAEIVAVTVPGRDDGGARGASVEAAARKARYTALVAAAGDDPVAVAHTLDDQAETFLLGGLRGSPQGMLEVTGHHGGTVVRPLLGARRADTVGACRELGLAAWRDPHNSDPAFRRVRVRREVIPLLAEVVGGDPAPALARAATRAADAAAMIAEQAAGVDADCAALSRAPGVVRREAIARLIRRAGAEPKAATVGAVEKMVTEWHGQGPVAVGGGLVVIRSRGRLAVQQQKRGTRW